MIKTSMKNKLLLGAAGVAMAMAMGSAQASAQTLVGNSTWGTTAPVNAPTAGDDVDLNSFDLTINDTDQTAVGDITDTGTPADGNITVTSDTGSADVTLTIGSINTSGDFTVQSLQADDATVAVTVSGTTTLGGNIDVTNATETSAADTITLTLTGNATVTGTTDLTAGGLAAGGTTATLNLDGASNAFTGLVTITGGAGNAANDSTLIASGAANAFNGGLTLTDGAAGQAIFTLDGGTTAQTVSGTIAGNGDINVENSAGVTFSGAVTSGTIVIEQAAADSAATFQNTVTSAITLGGAGTDTNTLTFDTTTQAFTVTGAVAGAIAGETNNVVIAGDDVLEQDTGWTANIDSIAVNGTSTLDSDAALTTSGTITVASGATLDQGAGLITATGGLVNNGTVQFTGTGNLTAAVTGTGALDVDANTTITGAVTQNTADIAAVTLTLADGTDGYTVGTTTFSADGTLDIGNGSRTVTGNFTNSTDAEGTIQVQNGAGTTAFVGDLGASTANSLKAFTFEDAGGTAQTVTSTGNWYVDATTLDANDTLQFLGTSAQTVSGTIDGAGAGEGILTVGDGTAASNVTFNGIIGGTTLASATVSANATANFDANATLAGALTNTGTTTVGTGATLTTTGALPDTGAYVSDVSDADGTLTAADFGQYSAGAGAIDTDRFSFNVTGFVGTGTADILTTATFDEAKAVADNSALFSFTAATDGTITVAQEETSSITSSSTSQNAADELLSIGAAATGELDTVLDTFVSAGNDTVDDVLEATTSVNSNAGGAAAGFTVGNQTASLNNARLASLRDGTAETGMAAGNAGQGVKVWGQAFGTTGQQDERDGISGYDVDTYGFAVGADTEAAGSNTTVGVAFAYADTEVDSDGLANAKTDIDSYQVALYGQYDIDAATYVTGQVSYMWSENDTTRNPGGVSSITASGDYDADQWGVRAELARDYAAGGNLTLTPSVLANYVSYNADGYTETGAGTANLTVSDADIDLFELGVGVDAAWQVQNSDGSYVKPVLSAGVRHDLIGDEYEATNTFAGGGNGFRVQGFDPAQTTFDLGAGLTYFATSNWELSAEYDYEFKSDYDAHSGSLKAAYKF